MSSAQLCDNMQIGICVFSVLDLSPDYINVWCGTTLTLRSAAAAPRHWAAVSDRRHLQRGANIAAHTTRAGFTGDKLPSNRILMVLQATVLVHFLVT